MLETDADRLASIKGLGGQLARFENGDAWAIFDAPGAEATFGDSHVNSSAPFLTMRTADVDLLDIGRRRAAVTVDEGNFTVREHQRGSAPGWSVLVLDEAS